MQLANIHNEMFLAKALATTRYLIDCTCKLRLKAFNSSYKPFTQLQLHIVHVQCTCTCMCEYVDQNSLAAIIFLFILCCYLSSLVGESISLECRMAWVQIPLKAANFSQSWDVCCVALYCLSIESLLNVMYNVYNHRWWSLCVSHGMTFELSPSHIEWSSSMH